MGRSVDGASGVPVVQSRRFCGAERNSIHFQAASWFLDPAGMMRVSPATVVAHRLRSGSAAAAHLPVMSGNELSISPANQAPATYIATWPSAKATRPSQEFELR